VAASEDAQVVRRVSKNILKSEISKIYILLRNNSKKFNKTTKAKIEIRK